MNNRLPDWFRQKSSDVQAVTEVQDMLEKLKLHTICEGAECPNVGQCLSQRTATFMILGDRCTRHCTFCAVKKGSLEPVDPTEPDRLLEAVKKLDLSYVVITSVTRDDLADGGASHYAEVIDELSRDIPGIKVEVLIPDFQGSQTSLETVISANPQVINHNIETVPDLYHEVRPEANYERSIQLLILVKEIKPDIITKSGLMVGLGETREEVIEVMNDLREADCDLLTIGQYLQPTNDNHLVVRYVSPEEFVEYETIGKVLGFKGVASSPLVRSSYKAAEMYMKARAPLSE